MQEVLLLLTLKLGVTTEQAAAEVSVVLEEMV
jgi:hypothetical protein